MFSFLFANRSFSGCSGWESDMPALAWGWEPSGRVLEGSSARWDFVPSSTNGMRDKMSLDKVATRKANGSIPWLVGFDAV
jgi:hypothetical protein